MAKTITLKHSAICTECGADLPVGTQAKYYNLSHIYGLTCHEHKPKASRDYSVYNSAWEKIGSSCGCEDYPCCGH